MLYDTEEEYAHLMTDFLKKSKKLPWELHTYTNQEDLFREEGGGLEMLVVSESAFSRRLREIECRCLVVLNESGIMKWEDVIYVDKYQEAEEVLRYLLGIYMEAADVRLPRIGRNKGTVFIGVYSPVKRCMQTSFSMAMGQMLARGHPTLYLNFEQYAGIGELLPDMQTLDMADLLYFLNADMDRFRLRMQTMLKSKGGLAYIPPMKSGQNLLAVTAEEWMGLFRKIEDSGEFAFAVLDLGESMQGLFEILRMCTRIYTLTREDRIAKGKLMQYEQVMALYEYGDVLGKTKNVSIAHIRRLPGELEQLTKGDMADLVKKLLDELLADIGGEGDSWSTRD